MDPFLVALITMFFLIEALIEVVKKLVDGFDWEVVVSFALGGLGAVFFGIDLFAYLAVPAAINIPWLVLVVNAIFLGILTARYSGELNALLEILKGFKVTAQNKINGG